MDDYPYATKRRDNEIDRRSTQNKEVRTWIIDQSRDGKGKE